MKTTVDLPDSLLIAAKKRAAEERLTLKVLIERGLRRQLARAPDGTPRSRAIRWITVDGGVPPGLDVGDRALMREWIRQNR
jgi:hypothetical protein